MRLITLTLLSATALAAPTTSTYASTLHELSIQTIQSDTCALPQPSNNCAGFNMSDVIIQYGKANKEQQDLVMSAAKSSGATIIHDYKDFGYVYFQYNSHYHSPQSVKFLDYYTLSLTIF